MDRLFQKSDFLTEKSVLSHLNGFDGIRVSVIKRVDSTNRRIKAMALSGEPEGRILIAEEQTAGYGRYGRTFHSPASTGLYMSFLLRPSGSAASALSITTAAAVAVSAAIEEIAGRKTEIKWVNDILLDGKKVCGILTEGAVDPESNRLSYAVLGIGVNVYEPIGGFPEDIRFKAGAVFSAQQTEGRARLAAEVIRRVMSDYRAPEPERQYRQYVNKLSLLGKPIVVLKKDGEIPAVAVSLDHSYRLCVRYENGREEWLDSGEIGIRFT